MPPKVLKPDRNQQSLLAFGLGPSRPEKPTKDDGGGEASDAPVPGVSSAGNAGEMHTPARDETESCTAHATGKDVQIEIH